MLIYFLLTLGQGIRVIFSQWASITYSWILADVNALSSFEMSVSGCLLLSLPLLSHHILKPRLVTTSSVDIFVTKASVLAIALGVLCMGFAPTRAS
jgi:hypothetical protein